MHLLITRPGDDGARLADTLRSMGHDPLFEPLLTIRQFDGPPLDLSGVQAILATSANGVRAIASRNKERKIPLYAVGDATARSAKEAGFLDVSSASGDVSALATLVRQKLDPAKGSLMHVAGSEVAGDLSGQLSAAGFTVRREVLYESESAYSLSPSTIAAIKEERIDGVLAYSPRTASTLARLIRKARLVRDCRRIELFCLSPAVAEAANDIPWARAHIAAEPTQEALLALVRTSQDTPSTAVVEPIPPHPVPAAAKGSGAFRAVLVTLAVVIVAAIAAYLTQPYWRAQVAQYLPFLGPDDSAQLRLTALDRRLAALEAQARDGQNKAPATSPDASAAAERAQLQARVEKLETALESVRTTAQQGAAGDESAAREALRQVGDRLNSVASDTAVRIDRLARQIETIEQSVPAREDADAVRNARLVFAIGRLRDGVLSTHPFRIELAALKALSGDDAGINQALDRLAPHADAGVPTQDLLRQRFRRLASGIVNASREPVSDSWLDRSIARVLGAINIRRVDNVEGGDAEAIVARAEQALDRGDIKQAASELGALSGPGAAVAKPWLADADAYLAATTALVDLQTRAFAELGMKRN
jgi:uroporphyrinogen-III synthase